MNPNLTSLPKNRQLLVCTLAAGWMLSACSILQSHKTTAVEPPQVVARADTPTDTGPQTVTEALGDLPEGATATVIEGAGAVANASAPRSYVVKRGDTLWGLSQMFLRDAWLWPEIWYVNPQVRNPHLIYPGDTLQLAVGRDGKTALLLTRGPGARLQPLLRSTALGEDGPIATIPYAAIRAFLSRPGLISKSEAKVAPYIYAIRNNHVMAGSGDEVYVNQITGSVGERYSIMHIDKELVDPDGHEKLGNLAIYSGAGLLTRTGKEATASITESTREILSGDVLMPAVAPVPQNIVPHAPARKINGHIIGIVNGVLLAGQYQVVAVNRGTRHGLEIGHVLRVRENDVKVRDTCVHVDSVATCRRMGLTSLPNETAGTLLVFRVLDKLSYALIVSELTPVHDGDRVGNP